jgi:CheY-like chemotaxis protein
MMGTKILCIDDDHETAALIAEALTGYGYNVRVAHGGRQGFRAMTLSAPDLVLCDVSMPGTTGFEVHERLAEFAPDQGHIPFVFVTAFPHPADERCHPLGAHEFVSKPIDFERLRSVVSDRLAGAGREKLVPKRSFSIRVSEVRRGSRAA